MRLITDKREVVRQLERDVLRNIVLLKHINAFPGHARATLLRSDRGAAALVLLDARASAHDREAYPKAAHVVLINSDELALTRRLLRSIPQGGGIVFKLSSDEERDIVGETYVIERATSYLSFTSAAAFPADSQVLLGETASDAMFDMFRSQHHSREWLQPLLAAGRAFTCVLNAGTEPLSACFCIREPWTRVGNRWCCYVTIPSRPGARITYRAGRFGRVDAARAAAPLPGERGQPAVDRIGSIHWNDAIPHPDALRSSWVTGRRSRNEGRPPAPPYSTSPP
jgi:hypothetical protein